MNSSLFNQSTFQAMSNTNATSTYLHLSCILVLCCNISSILLFITMKVTVMLENFITIIFSTIKWVGLTLFLNPLHTGPWHSVFLCKTTVKISLIYHQWYRCNIHRNVIKKQLSSSSVQYSIQLFISILFKHSLGSFAFLCKTH